MSIKGNWRQHGSEVVIRWYQRFFSRRFATCHRGFATQFCRPQREKNLWHQGSPRIIVLESQPGEQRSCLKRSREITTEPIAE